MLTLRDPAIRRTERRRRKYRRKRKRRKEDKEKGEVGEDKKVEEGEERRRKKRKRLWMSRNKRVRRKPKLSVLESGQMMSVLAYLCCSNEMPESEHFVKERGLLHTQLEKGTRIVGADAN